MAIDFDGTDDRLDIHNFSVPLTSTLMFWVKLDTTAAQRLVGAGDKWEIRITGTGQPFRSDMRDTGSPIESTTNPSTGVWYHVACSNNNTSPYTNKIWVDGVLETTGNNNNDSSTGGYSSFSIGCRYPNTSPRTNGKFEDVRIYNRVLSTEEVATIHACKGTDGIVDGLLYRWPLTDREEGVNNDSAESLVTGITNDDADLVGGPTYQSGIIKMRRRV